MREAKSRESMVAQQGITLALLAQKSPRGKLGTYTDEGRDLNEIERDVERMLHNLRQKIIDTKVWPLGTSQSSSPQI